MVLAYGSWGPFPSVYLCGYLRLRDCYLSGNWSHGVLHLSFLSLVSFRLLFTSFSSFRLCSWMPNPNLCWSLLKCSTVILLSSSGPCCEGSEKITVGDLSKELIFWCSAPILFSLSIRNRNFLWLLSDPT